jgi:hypothetical protein
MRSTSMNLVQGTIARADVRMGNMENGLVERRRTVVALVSASVISIVVWGLVVVLNIH